MTEFDPILLGQKSPLGWHWAKTKTNKFQKLRMIFFSVSDTGILGKRNSEFSQQESNLRPSDYKFGRSTTELQETRGS